jgi:uncharacterized membrane protein
LIQSVVLSTAIALALAWLVVRWWPERQAMTVLALYATFVVVGAPLLPWRYDLLPALLTLLALLGVATGRPIPAGLCLGLGIAAKLYPAVLLPVFGLYYLIQRQYARLIRLVITCTGVVLAAFLPFALLDPAWLASLGYYGVRGLQIETLPGGVLLLANALGLARTGVTSAVGAYQLVSPIADGIVRWQPIMLAIAFGAVLLSTVRRFRQDYARGQAISIESLVMSAALALMVFIATNKVFSAQHMVWLLPLAPLLRVPQAALLLAAWALTNLLFPWHYEDLTDGRLFPVLILNLRNLVVAVLIVWLLVEPFPLLRRAPATRPLPLRG